MLVSTSIRSTVPSAAFVTQTAPSPTAMPEGERPTGIVSATDPSSSRSRTTRSRSGSTTHALPKPIAISPGRRSSSNARSTDPVLRVESRERVRGERGAAPPSLDVSSGMPIALKARATTTTATRTARDRRVGVGAFAANGRSCCIASPSVATMRTTTPDRRGS